MQLQMLQQMRVTCFYLLYQRWYVCTVPTLVLYSNQHAHKTHACTIYLSPNVVVCTYLDLSTLIFPRIPHDSILYPQGVGTLFGTLRASMRRWGALISMLTGERTRGWRCHDLAMTVPSTVLSNAQFLKRYHWCNARWYQLYQAFLPPLRATLVPVSALY